MKAVICKRCGIGVSHAFARSRATGSYDAQGPIAPCTSQANIQTGQSSRFVVIAVDLGSASDSVQIFKAMDFCHRSRMIHGDMKLAQVLLKRRVVPPPVSLSPPASDTHRTLPAVHVKVAGHVVSFGPDSPRSTYSLIVCISSCVFLADFGDSRFSLRHSMDSSSAGTSGCFFVVPILQHDCQAFILQLPSS